MLQSFTAALPDLLGSKKFILFLVGLVGWALAKFGIHADPDSIVHFLELVGAAIGAQGIADHGKEKAKIDQQTAIEVAKIHASSSAANAASITPAAA